MLRSAIDSFLRQDEAAAVRLIQRDVEVDALRDQLIGALMRRMSEDPMRVSEALSLVFVVQSLERVGDHAKNIAEYIMHVVSGVDSRHPVRQAPANPT
jgi:phosphate transport system protein